MNAQSSRSYASIARSNTFTIPNAILLAFGVLTVVFVSWRDALFLGILVSNVVIGSFQEVRSKRALDRLAALIAPRATVVRDGEQREVEADSVVAGDLVRLRLGEQVVADGALLEVAGLALDESALTGESTAVIRNEGESVWAGSFVVEGTALLEVAAAGPDTRAAKLTRTARAFRHPRSPLERANDRLLLWLVALALPLGLMLGTSVFLHSGTTAKRIQTLTAALVNLVPEGLILLVSLSAAVAGFRAARRGVLPQQLNAVESIASVDLVCTDKTGTLTEPRLRLIDTAVASGVEMEALGRELATFAASTPDHNATLAAIAEAELAEPGGQRVVASVPFASRRRWSALDLGDHTLYLGAPERFSGIEPDLAARIEAETAAGRRVLAIGRSAAHLEQADKADHPGTDVRVLGVAILAESLRPSAASTVAFLQSEGVTVRLLSGDAPATVGAIARDVGVDGAGGALDGDELPEDPAELRDAVLAATAVGRIAPEKKRAVVEALTGAGRYVAMIGDGVNDVPALKAARLAVAQGSGTQMARSVADLVLVRDDFSAVPAVIDEGRNILRNIQRVARLFVTKTVFTAVVAVAVAIPTATFPLLPRQFTIAATVTIGIPAFVLALAPSSGPWRPDRFLSEVARFAVPAGISIGVGIICAYLLARYAFGLDLPASRTVATGVVVGCGLATVLRLESTGGGDRKLVLALCAAMALIFVISFVVPVLRSFYELTVPGPEAFAAWAAGSALGIGGMLVSLRLLRV